MKHTTILKAAGRRGLLKLAMVKAALPAWQRMLPTLGGKSIERLGLGKVNLSKVMSPQELVGRVSKRVSNFETKYNVTADNSYTRRFITESFRRPVTPKAVATSAFYGARRRMGTPDNLAEYARQQELMRMRRGVSQRLNNNTPFSMDVQAVSGRRPMDIIRRVIHPTYAWDRWGRSGGVVNADYDRGAHTVMMRYMPNAQGTGGTTGNAVLGHEMGHVRQAENPNLSNTIGSFIHKHLSPTIKPSQVATRPDEILTEGVGHFLGTNVNIGGRGTLKLPLAKARREFPDNFAQWKESLDPRMSPKLRERMLSTRAHLFTNYGFRSPTSPSIKETIKSWL